MSNAERIPSLSALLRTRMNGALEDVHTAMPVRVETYDASLQRVSVQPVLKRAFTDEEGERQVERLPVITGVPVQFPSGGGYRLTFPIANGDTGLLIFCEASLDVWLSQGGEVDPLDDRRFDLSDGIFIPGVRSFAAPIGDAHETKFSLGKEGGPQIYIDGTKIQLGGESGMQACALGDNIEDYLLSASPTSLRTWLTALAAFVGFVPPGFPAYPSLATLKSNSVEVKP
jgi:hypothetical protein